MGSGSAACDRIQPVYWLCCTNRAEMHLDEISSLRLTGNQAHGAALLLYKHCLSRSASHFSAVLKLPTLGALLLKI